MTARSDLRIVAGLCAFTAFFLALILYPRPARAGGKAKPRIAVIDFSANNADPAMAGIVRNAVEMNLFRDGSFDILEQSRVADLVRERKLQLAECRDEGCATKIGRLLKGDYVIIGSLDRLDAFTVNVKVVDVKEGRIIFTESRDVSEVRELRAATAEVARRVAARIKKAVSPGLRFPYPVIVTAHFICTVPVGYLRSLTREGFGAVVTARIQDLPVRGLYFGLDTRVMFFKGRGTVHNTLMAPLMVQTGYSYTYRFVSIVPRFSFGGCYILNTYYADALRLGKSVRRGFQPVLSAGGSLEFNLPKNVHVGAGADYGVIFEKGGSLSFVSFLVGVGLRF
jgi:TolB-like protein